MAGGRYEKKQRAWRAANKDEIAEKQRAYYAANKDEIAEKQRARARRELAVAIVDMAGLPRWRRLVNEAASRLDAGETPSRIARLLSADAVGGRRSV